MKLRLAVCLTLVMWFCAFAAEEQQPQGEAVSPDSAPSPLWNITSSMGRAIYISDLHVKKARCGRRIKKGTYRLQAMLERDHFRGNTAIRGWVTSSPSKELTFPMSLAVDIQREDQVRTSLRWTLEARNNSWATWERLFRSEASITQLIEEDSDQHCMILFPKVLPSSRTYRKEPCDHVLCFTLHHTGTDTYPPDQWVHSTPLEAIITVAIVGIAVIWILSGWITQLKWRRVVYLSYLVPLGFLGAVVYYRLQGIQHVTQAKVVLYDIHWGFGEGLSYGTDADQDYQYNATFEFQSHTTGFQSSLVTGMAVSRTPDEIKWPEVLSWPLPDQPTPAHTLVTLRALVLADGKPVDQEYVLTFDAAVKSEESQLCARTSDAPQPRFCLKYHLVAPAIIPEVPFMDRMPGFGILGYGAIGFVLFVIFRKRKVEEEADDKDAMVAKKTR